MSVEDKNQKKEEETVTISKKEYEELLDDRLFLQCLQESGVDNWDWYDDAVAAYRAEKREEEG